MSNLPRATGPELIIEDIELRTLAEQVLNETKLEVIKGIANTIDKVKYPLKTIETTQTIESAAAAFLATRKAEKQAVAKHNIQEILGHSEQVMLNLFGESGKVDFKSNKTVVDQIKSLGIHDRIRIKESQLSHLEISNNFVRKRAVVADSSSSLSTVPLTTGSLVNVGTVGIADAIETKYQALGGKNGFLRNAVGGRGTCPDGKGRFQHYQGGSIYWSPTTKAFEVHGQIREKWKTLGWETSFLGYPLTDERTTPDGVGRYNHFQGGSIYWTPETGAHEVHGAIRSKWAAMGWEKCYLGYPKTDEKTTPDTIGRYSHFQGGSIYWTPSTGAHAVHLNIRNKWESKGWELGYLGYPINDTVIHGNGNQMECRFQGGEIVWRATGGTTDTMPMDTLRLRIHKVKCLDETNPEWLGDDEIDLGGVATSINDGNAVKISQFRVRSDFEDGVQKVYDPPREFCTFDLRAIPGWPKQFAVSMALAEIDMGGFNDFLKTLLEKIREKVLALIVQKTAELIGAALGSLIGSLGGPLGSVIGAVIGWLVGKLFDWLLSLFEDDPFPPWTAELKLPSVWHRWGASTDSPEYSFWTQAHGGKYEVWFDWQITP